MQCRSQWPRGLRRGSSAVRLLRLWVRMQQGARMFVCLSVVCCQVEVSETDWPLVQRSLTDCGASLCVSKKPRKNEEAKARYRAVKNTTTVGCNVRKTNKQKNMQYKYHGTCPCWSCLRFSYFSTDRSTVGGCTLESPGSEDIPVADSGFSKRQRLLGPTKALSAFLPR
jgi:hypothetical protein